MAPPRLVLQWLPAATAIGKALREVRRVAVRAGSDGRAPGVLRALPLRERASDAGVVHGAFLAEGVQPFLRLRGAGVEREPVPRVADGQMPAQVAPEVDLLLRVAGHFGQLVRERTGQDLHGRVELAPGHDPVDQSPRER